MPMIVRTKAQKQAIAKQKEMQQAWQPLREWTKHFSKVDDDCTELHIGNREPVALQVVSFKNHGKIVKAVRGKP